MQRQKSEGVSAASSLPMSGRPPPRPVPSINPLSTNRGRFGLLARALAHEVDGGGGDSDMSPNSIRNFMNPLRSQLGLAPITAPLPTLSDDPDTEEFSRELETNAAKSDPLPRSVLPEREVNEVGTGDKNSTPIPFHNFTVPPKRVLVEAPLANPLPAPSIDTECVKPSTESKIISDHITVRKPRPLNLPLPRPVLSNPVEVPKSESKNNLADSMQPLKFDWSPPDTVIPLPPPPAPIIQKAKDANITGETGVGVGNEQNIEPPKSGPLFQSMQGPNIAVRIPQKNTSSKSVNGLPPSGSGAGVGESQSAANGNGNGTKTINKNITGPVMQSNWLPSTPGAGLQSPFLGPPAAPLSSAKKKNTKKSSGGSGWKFANDTVLGKEYLILKELGKGGCGQVFLVMEKESRQLFALKKVNLAGFDPSSIQECITEVTMLIELKDSELVIQIDSWEMNQTDNTMKIIMEYGHCDLNKSLNKSHRISFSKLKFIWERLLQIVEVIHSRGIVHADLKPANFVWVGENLKIIDFGIANRLQTDHTSIPTLNPKGTLNFISPETIRPDAFGRAKIGPKSDIWSLGCILYLMVYGRTPFQDITHQVSKMNAIITGNIPYPPPPPELQNSSVVSVLKLCFELDTRKRPTASELLKHPFFYESSFNERPKGKEN